MGREVRKGYLGNYAPPFGGGVGGGAAISLSHFTPLPLGEGEGGGAGWGFGCLVFCLAHIKPSTDSHTIQHIAVGGTDSREARLSKGIVRNIVQSL